MTFFSPFHDEFVPIYLDEILVYSRTWDDDVSHVKKVLDVFKNEKFYVKISKCEFGKSSLVYLGHIVGGGQLKMDPSNIEVIVKFAKPNNVTKVRSLFGAVRYFRSFISNLFFIASSLHYLMSVNQTFQCGGK